MAIRLEGKTYKVLAANYHAGQGKMGGVTHAQLKNLSTGTLLDQAFRADLRLEDLPIQKQTMEFIYSDADQCYFMHPTPRPQSWGPELASFNHKCHWPSSLLK